jgi:hypothetical protein
MKYREILSQSAIFSPPSITPVAKNRSLRFLSQFARDLPHFFEANSLRPLSEKKCGKDRQNGQKAHRAVFRNWRSIACDLWRRRKNSQSDQKILYFKEKNSKLKVIMKKVRSGLESTPLLAQGKGFRLNLLPPFRESVWQLAALDFQN